MIIEINETPLMIQCSRIHLEMQGVWVRSLLGNKIPHAVE